MIWTFAFPRLYIVTRSRALTGSDMAKIRGGYEARPSTVGEDTVSEESQGHYIFIADLFILFSLTAYSYLNYFLLDCLSCWFGEVLYVFLISALWRACMCCKYFKALTLRSSECFHLERNKLWVFAVFVLSRKVYLLLPWLREIKEQDSPRWRVLMWTGVKKPWELRTKQ